MQEHENVVDISSLKDRLEGDLDLFLEISQIFFKDFPVHLEVIEESLKSGDSKSIRDRAHTLKGALANLSVIKGSAIAFEIEKMGRDNQLSGTKEALDAFKYEIERFTDFVNEVKQGNHW